MGSSLCENCHKRPQYGTHNFCGKACATQAAAKPARSKQSQPQAKPGPRNAGPRKGAPAPQKAIQLCIHCGQKPKFNGFDYCGKSCAALAGTTQTKPPATKGIPTKQKTTGSSNTPLNNAAAPLPMKPPKVPPTKVPVPQGDSTEEDEEPGEDEEDGGVSTDLDAYPSDSGSESEGEPSMPAVSAPQPGGKTTVTSKSSKPGSGAPKVAPGACAIPGCGQQSHVDKHGVKTMYCSIKHREEAVKLGLEAACIMCQRYPQSTSDYFCSSACRNQSMTKT
ncbi:hypothetical protein HD554DRAFT_2053957 [Boletus coccyginus]|nr:hypothetical protein HD554DRAFT_2053957 [Boletus coccyginus]